MNQQEMYSLAIQALHERIDMIRRGSNDLEAIRECELTISFLMGAKEINHYLSGLGCKVDIRTADTDCGNKV